MVILQVAAPATVGGLESVVQALSTGLAARGHDVHVAILVNNVPTAHSFKRALEHTRVRVSVVQLPHRAYLRERYEIRRLARRIGPHVAHTHGYRADVVHGRSLLGLGFPTVTTVHGYVGGGWKNRLYERLQRRAFRRFTAVVAVSRALASSLVQDRVPADRVRLLPNAWDGREGWVDRAAARRTLGLGKTDCVVGWVGRLSAEKGPDLVLQALARMKNRSPHLCVIGDGCERSALEAQARALGIAERVRWCGVVAEAARLFPAFDVFVSSSRTEGMPMVLFEAMAAGVPIVATRVGGVPDVISEAEGVLVGAGSSTPLAEAIDGILARPDQAEARAQAARQRLAREFSPDPWIDRYEALYREVGGKAHGSCDEGPRVVVSPPAPDGEAARA